MPPHSCIPHTNLCSIHSFAQGLLALLVPPGGNLLVESFTYPNILESNCLPRSVNAVPINMDAKGLDPNHLDAVSNTVAWKQRDIHHVYITFPRHCSPTLLPRRCFPDVVSPTLFPRHALTLLPPGVDRLG